MSNLEVALLAEGVDRNFVVLLHLKRLSQVALLAEGVDRNIARQQEYFGGKTSPSSRRA